ncbi:hypothetical protein Ccar_06820 [Clostridium carboxidivorans P7]|uniref:Uncharacterized protein n=1 Tax=Clostridium carboxidivorans P7 TaxID=536227 RepID=C6PUE8_9CLOT|nr:hypothetical protein [Clostridium carboxidivorans]AKN30552.1 hypothetical protein Ccar_06820 [Clostridium carboxidivorans P7]EET87146.1 conserved hypothetical protein [Clostridium carboxidivorans P7]EFG86298.1 hypothetical protein CLCAR_4124 [Clostridium carboxidivorans P7]
MKKIDEAIDRIKTLECATGNLENRIVGILEEYGVADRSKIDINRNSNFDTDEAQGYKVKIEGEPGSIVVVAKSGYDDYVAEVIDAYSKS